MVTLVNRAKVSTATTGTGTITLGAAESGYQSFADAGVSDGDTVRYVIEDGENWEIGTGSYTASGATLTRTVSESSNADAAINLTGAATLFVTAAVGDFLEPDNNLSDVGDAPTALGNLGLTATAAELNTLDGITASTSELNKLDGVAATTTEINYLSGVTSNIQTQLDSISGTAGSLTKSFLSGEVSSISLSSALSPAPVVSVTKEASQVGVVSKGSWDVATSGGNYERLDSAYDTTLTPSGGTLTLGSGSFASTDVGKTIEGNGGVALLTATDGSYIEVTAFTDSGTIAAGDWAMYGAVFDAENGLELSGAVVDAWDISTASYVQNFSVSSQEADPYGVFFKPDGTKMYVVGGAGDDVNEYNLSTAWSVSTASYSRNFSVLAQDINPMEVFFKPDGTTMYIVGLAGQDINEYDLSTAWDVSTASYVQNFSVSAQEAQPRSVYFKPDGSKMYVVGTSGDDVNEYDLSTAWDVSTASFLRTFSVSAQETAPLGIFFKIDGSKMYVIGSIGDDVNEYNLSTAWDISTASYSQNYSVSAITGETTPHSIFFKPDGSKMYVVGTATDRVFEYNIGSFLALTNQYTPSVTNTGGQIDSAFWLDINGMTTDEDAGAGNVYYAVSTDSRTTWSVIKDADGVRPIVRDNGGTWEYNSNAAYGSTTWTSATTNAELSALQEALTEATVNRMDKTQLEAVTDPNHYTLGDTLDLMIGLYLGSSSASLPSSDGVSIDYDAESLNKGAILGTDYDYDFPDSTTVRITSNATQNLKIRVV